MDGPPHEQPEHRFAIMPKLVGPWEQLLIDIVLLRNADGNADGNTRPVCRWLGKISVLSAGTNGWLRGTGPLNGSRTSDRTVGEDSEKATTTTRIYTDTI